MQVRKIINSFFFWISFLIFFCEVAFVHAQRFNAGFSLGAVASDIHGMDQRDRDNDFNKLGFTVGGIVNTKVNEKNIFQMEINYIQKGSMQNPDSAHMDYYKFVADYVDVALLFRHHMKFTIRKSVIDRFDWEAGVSIGRMVRNTWTSSLGNSYSTAIDESKINKTDISPLIGLDYNLSSKVCLGIRYSNSVIPVIKHDAYPGYLIWYNVNIGNNLAAQFFLKVVFGGTAHQESHD